jgi:hypothetical protein
MNCKRLKIPGYQLLCYLIIGIGFPGIGKAQAIFQKTTVWQEKESGYFTHFVYGLTVTKKGSVLAFAEARIENGSDQGAHHIVMKRSRDKGASFSASKILVASDNGQCWANPTALVENKTGTIFLFYALNEHNAQFIKKVKMMANPGLHQLKYLPLWSRYRAHKSGCSCSF